ncbi:hypothetical protein [Nocardiopsis algeriensis]|uniref:Uncharacterized protein n=1 Tax=Nocardiopsis algeriensis TaxID=1478215 RepID=A0A841IQW1_9ACTN|nr:hypothetical protein [Nocardiopsis algeriensis]MBB6120600.1 hypothetical protein [Nocardiopsis algeriensis]
MEKVDRCLVQGGWEKEGDDGPSYVKNGPGGAVYSLGLCVSLRESWVLFLPALGVAFPEVGNLYDQFFGSSSRRSDGGGSPSVASSLVEILGSKPSAPISHDRWMIWKGENFSPKVDLLCADIEFAETRFLAKFRNIDDVANFLEGMELDFSQNCHLALIQALQGRMGEAVVSLGDCVRKLEDSPLVAEQAWRFIDSFIEYFSVKRESVPFLGVG